MSSSDKHRRNTDVNKLMESKHDVTILGGLDEIVVKFYGPDTMGWNRSLGKKNEPNQNCPNY